MAKTVDKDSIIADLQAKIQSLTDDLDFSKRELERTDKRADENFKNGRAWKDAVDSAESARKDSLAKERAAAELRLEAEKKLSFAEGYIAALKGEPYEKPVAEERSW